MGNKNLASKIKDMIFRKKSVNYNVISEDNKLVGSYIDRFDNHDKVSKYNKLVGAYFPKIT